jgi:sugar/nucleoside kinase (ribokinase family)
MMGVDVLTPNQLEAEALLGLEQSIVTKTRRKVIDPKQIGMDLLARGPKSVVLKLGKKGAMLVGRDGEIELVREKREGPTTTQEHHFSPLELVSRALQRLGRGRSA